MTSSLNGFTRMIAFSWSVIRGSMRRSKRASPSATPGSRYADAKLDEIVRQRDPELKRAVEELARGDVGAALESLDRQSRVHEVRGMGIASLVLLGSTLVRLKAPSSFRPITVLAPKSLNEFMISCIREAW